MKATILMDLVNLWAAMMILRPQQIMTVVCTYCHQNKSLDFRIVHVNLTMKFSDEDEPIVAKVLPEQKHDDPKVNSKIVEPPTTSDITIANEPKLVKQYIQFPKNKKQK